MNRRTLNRPLIAATLAAAVGIAWWVNTQRDRLPDGIHRGNGRVEVERIEVAAKYPGRIVELPVREGDLVKAGDVIARQDPTDLLAQRAAVEAARDRAGQAMQRAGAETEVRVVQARIAQLELDHATRLKQDALVSGAEVERRTAQRDGERAGIQVARAAIGEATAARAEAQAQIQRINVALDDLVLRAPVAGRIEYRVVEPGSVIPSGGRVVTLLNTAEVHMTLFLPTDVAGGLKLGDEARIVLDAAPQFVIPAVVSFVAAEAQFTPKYVETASEREKLVFRVKLKVAPELASRYAPHVKAGLTGYGHVRSDASKAWPASLAVKLPDAPAPAASSAAPSAGARPSGAALAASAS